MQEGDVCPKKKKKEAAVQPAVVAVARALN
jgi:hypothetical protein